MRRLKVIRVYKGLKAGGGVPTRLVELLPRLAEHADMRVLCYRTRGERAPLLEEAGVPVDLVPLGAKWAPWNVARYVDYFRSQRPDVVHCHELTANTLGVVAAARAGVPVRVRHLHTLAPWGWGGRLRTALRVVEDRLAARAAQATLAVSAAVRRLYLERLRAAPESCRVLYNGVDLERFRDCRQERAALRASLAIPSDAPVVGVVGRLSRGKGHEEFLRAAQEIGYRLPRARFLVVGEGGNRAALEALAEELGIGGRVVFTGHRADVPAVLGAMDVFLFSSGPDASGRVQDGLPGAVIEAQAAALPVVAFELPMMDELLDDPTSGTVVAPGDVQAAADACLGYLADPGRTAEAGAAALRSASRFALSRCVDATMGLYEELAAGVGRG